MKLIGKKIKKSVGDLKPTEKTLRRKEFTAKPFRKIWPRILEDMIENPKITQKELWKKWGTRISDSAGMIDFNKKLSVAGLGVVKIRKANSVTEHVAIAIKTFANSKKVFAERHLERIHAKLEEVHNQFEKMPVHEKNIGYMLDLTSRLHKEGRIAYDIDVSNTPDQKVTNLAVLIGWEPTLKAEAVPQLKAVKARVVEVDPQ